MTRCVGGCCWRVGSWVAEGTWVFVEGDGQWVASGGGWCCQEAQEVREGFAKVRSTG